MILTLNQKYKLKQFAWISVVATCIGFLYTLIEDGWNLAALINGSIAGCVIGIVVAYLELFVFTSKLRRASFIYLFLLRIAIYFVIALAITFNLFLLSRAIRYNLSYSEAFYSNEFQTYLKTEYHLVLVFIFIAIASSVFCLQMARKLGVENMIAFITGKYRTPKKESRIFMFIRIEGIEEMIRKSGDLAFHNFLNDFIHNISEVIMLHKGNIVHYMDDQIVLSWTIQAGIENANCIRTYFEICQEIKEGFEYYYTQYGVLPRPKCALHSGIAIRAEIGEIKSEIAYFGDVLNTTSRILFEGKKINEDIVLSEKVEQLVKIPVYYRKKAVESFTPRGKKQSIQLYSLQPRHDP